MLRRETEEGMCDTDGKGRGRGCDGKGHSEKTGGLSGKVAFESSPEADEEEDRMFLWGVFQAERLATAVKGGV